MEGHIFIYGYISAYQDDDPGYWGEVNLKYVQNQIAQQSAADTLIVHINSMGGDVNEGFAIHDALQATGKKIITLGEGIVASIATVIFLAGETRRMTENTELMVHAPMLWGDGGTAAELQEQADYMKAVEDKIVDFYVKKTGQTKESILALMGDDTFMDSAKAKELGFATEVVATMKAVARINKNNDMSDKSITSAELDTKLDNFLTRMVKFLKGEGRTTMLTVTTADGTILDFGETITEESEIAVGSTATVDGSPASGDFTLTDGTVLTFENGAVTTIAEPEGDQTMEELQNKIAELEKENADLKAAATKQTNTVAELEKKMKKEMEDFKSQMKSDLGMDDTEERETEGGQPKNRHIFKSKE